MPDTLKLVGVLLAVLALVLLRIPSMYNEQFIGGLKASVAVKLKLIAVALVR